MSRESMEWLNNFTLIGNTEKRGNAWHYRQQLQGVESNHYTGPIPVADVLRRLFDWTAEKESMFRRRSNGEYIEIPDRAVIVRSDTEVVLGVFKQSYEPHQYSEWLLENIATILDDELGIGSAGLLRNGAQAWVSIEVPENITTPEGVEFRPNLTGTTSFDGSLATTYKRHVGLIVCDNTRDMALAEEGQQYKVKHTKYSGYKITDAREALQIVHTMSDAFAAEVAELSAWKVTDDEFMKHLQYMVPMNDELSKRAMTMGEKKREEIITLYRTDPRVAPWNGTAFGISQAYNTWRQHFATIRKGVPREVRNMENLLVGKTGAEDANVLKVLADVTGR
jgi:phage/plasmid-like protein (TIGR03299 family)